MNLTAYSLFSGIGGFDLGFTRAGIDIIGQCEVEPHCQEVLGKQFPGVELIPDVCEVDSVEADIICGGFPCQDVSVAGNRAGLAGERSGLWFEFARVIQRSRPRWVVIENVPGLLSSNRGRDMGTILGTLGNLGYGFAYRVLDAQWFGVPQRRQRVFVVGCLGDGRRAAQVLLEPEGGCGDPDAWIETRAQLAAGADARPRARSFRKSQRAHYTGDCETWDEADVANTLDAEGNSTRTAHAVAFSVYPDSGQGADLSARAIDLAPALSATDGKLHARGARIVDSRGLSVRRLMPIECERLQGFPDNWTEGHADSHRYRMLGNAVAVPVVEWIAKRIVEVESGGSP